MNDSNEAFSCSYLEARNKFLQAAVAAGLAVESHVHPLSGCEGEALAMDVARDGPDNAEALLILTSACHGVEGHCGSAVQVDALRDAAWRAHARGAGVAVLYVHALNPWGFSHSRRVTHEGVDLNRNFHDFSQRLPDNAAYAALHPLLLPAEWPPAADNETAIARYIAQHGPAAYQAAITRGQHAFADGLFFGGLAPTWSHQTWRQVLRQHGACARRLAWIDLHTGLGPSGVGERIYAGREDAKAIARARRWWDPQGHTPITSIYDGSSSSAYLTGLMWGSVYEECPQAEYTGIALEYGTVSMPEVMQALRADHWLAGHPEARSALVEAVRESMLRAFYTDTPEWKGAVLRQAREALRQAATGLAP